ncbi:methyltransferase domain-containing protein [Candidatus Micrarchaeota archaeon]|nr:methyltransferase domain-containing protein [Candidatus Micrarchaeota archaeon]
MRKPNIEIFTPSFLQGLKRGPSAILAKDFGTIIAYTEISKDSRVFDAGGGSGFFSLSTARLVKEVVVYERREDFAKIIEYNIKKLGLKNLKLKVKDVFKGIREKNFDLVNLDLPKSHEALPHAYKSLKIGGFISGFLPNVEQAKEFFLTARKLGFKDLKMTETIVREYDVREFGVRPKHFGLLHTAYLVFGKK